MRHYFLPTSLTIEGALPITPHTEYYLMYNLTWKNPASVIIYYQSYLTKGIANPQYFSFYQISSIEVPDFITNFIRVLHIILRYNNEMLLFLQGTKQYQCILDYHCLAFHVQYRNSKQ